MNGIKISEAVKADRKRNNKTAKDYAKEKGISYSLLKKYESGVCDAPSLLVASNYCKHFDISPTYFVENYKISNDPKFDKEDYLKSLLLHQHRDSSVPYKPSMISKYASKLDLSLLVSSYERKSLSYNSLGVESILANKNNDKIIFSYYGYNKVRNKQSIIYAYKHLDNDIKNVSLFPIENINVADKELYNIRNFIFATPSKKAFVSFYLNYSFSFYNDENSHKSNSTANVILLYLPSFNSPDLFYVNIIGNDFINANQYKLDTKSSWFIEALKNSNLEDI